LRRRAGFHFSPTPDRCLCAQSVFVSAELDLQEQMPYVFALALTMILAALTLPRTSGEPPYLPTNTPFQYDQQITQRSQSIPSSSSGSPSPPSPVPTSGATFVPSFFFETMLTPFQGTSYVSWPRLNPPVEILSYSGPGARSISRGRGLSIAGMIPPRLAKLGGSVGGRKAEEVELGRLGKRKGALID